LTNLVKKIKVGDLTGAQNAILKLLNTATFKPKRQA
jgi:hypothetical protein